MGSARQGSRHVAGADGPDGFQNRPNTEHKRLLHRRLLPALPGRQDQEFQRGQCDHYTSERETDLLNPEP
jgi:hypothetical protein